MITNRKVAALGAILSTVSTVLVWPAAAGQPDVSLERSGPVVFTDEVLPLLKRSCLACHNATKAKAELNLESVELIMKGSADGPVVVPGKAEESLLYALSAHLEDPVMPPENNKSNAPNLLPDELALLKLWIDEGAADDGGAPAAAVEFATMPAEVDAIYSVAISPDNHFAAAGRGNRIHLYHLPTGRSLGELRDPALAENGGAAHLDIVGALAFGADGLLASGGFRNVKLWRRSQNPLVAEFPPLGAEPSASAVSADGQWALVADASGGTSLYSLGEATAQPKIFRDHAAAVTGVGFADGGRLVSTSLDGVLMIRPAGGDGEPRQVAEFPSPVISLAIVDGGRRAACGCEDGMIRLVPFDDEPAVVELGGHDGKVTALSAFGESGMSLLSGGADAKIMVWDLGSTAAPVRQTGSSSPVAAAVADTDGHRIATLGEDKIVRLWNGADLQHVADLRTDAASVRSQAEAESALTIATGLRDTRNKALESAETGREEERDKARIAAEAEAAAAVELAAKLAALGAAEAAKRHADEALATKSAANHPDLSPAQEAAKAAGETLAKALEEAEDARRTRREAAGNAELAVRLSGRAAEASAAGDAALAASEAQVTAATAALEATNQAAGEAVATPLHLAFTADGGTLLASADDGSVHAWGAEGGAAAGVLMLSAGSAIASISATSGGQVMAVGADKSLAIYESTPQWQLERTIGSPDDTETFADRVNAVAFSRDGRWLATGGGVPSRGGELKIWRVPDGIEICANTTDHSDSISAVAFSPDGRHVATAATDRFVKVFSAEDGSILRAFEGHTNHVLDVTWRADGLALASSGADNVVKVWDYEAGTQNQTVTGHSKPVTSVAFVGPGDTLLSSSGDMSVRLANQPLPDTGTFIHSATSSTDGAIIAAGGEDSILRIWRTSDKTVLFKLH